MNLRLFLFVIIKKAQEKKRYQLNAFIPIDDSLHNSQLKFQSQNDPSESDAESKHKYAIAAQI